MPCVRTRKAITCAPTEGTRPNASAATACQFGPWTTTLTVRRSRSEPSARPEPVSESEPAPAPEPVLAPELARAGEPALVPKPAREPEPARAARATRGRRLLLYALAAASIVVAAALADHWDALPRVGATTGSSPAQVSGPPHRP